MLAEQGQVGADQGEEESRDQPHVDAEGAHQGDRPHEGSAPPEVAQEGAHQGQVARDVGRDHRRPVGRLVPGEHGAGDGHGQDQQEEAHPAEPVELAWTLVGARAEGPHHVQPEHQQEQVGVPEMDAAHHAGEGVVLPDVVQALPGLLDRGDEEHGEEDPGDQLDRDQHQGGAAQGVEPGPPHRDRFVESLAQQVADGGPLVEPLQGGAGHPSHICSVSRLVT